MTSADSLTYPVSVFSPPAKTNTRPARREWTWPQLTKHLTTHQRRNDKNGGGWSPATYKPGTTRANANVAEVSCAVADYDHITADDLLDVREGLDGLGLAYVVYSTYSSQPDNLCVRIVVPFTSPIPADQWTETWHRANHAIFRGRNDPQTKDNSRFFFTPAAPPDALVFGTAHDGDALDPATLPPAPGIAVAAKDAPVGAVNWIGTRTADFILKGAPIGDQRGRAVAAARACCSAGYSIDETANSVWVGFQACDQDPANPWTYEHALKIAQDIHSKPAPPLSRIRMQTPRPDAAEWDGSDQLSESVVEHIEYWKARAEKAEARSDYLTGLLKARNAAMQNKELTYADRVIADVLVMESVWAKDAPKRRGNPDSRIYTGTVAAKVGCSNDAVSTTIKKVAADMDHQLVGDDPPEAPLLKYREFVTRGQADPISGEILKEPRSFNHIVPNFPSAEEVYRRLAEWTPLPGQERKIGPRRKKYCKQAAHRDVELVSRRILQCPLDGRIYNDSHPELPTPKFSAQGSTPSTAHLLVPKISAWAEPPPLELEMFDDMDDPTDAHGWYGAAG